MLRQRAGIAVAVALALALATSGCAAGTVSGHGSADVVAPTTTAPTGAFPSGSGLPSFGLSTPILPPLSSLAPSLSGSAPSGAGVEVVDEGGHFRVVMPAEPERTTEPGSFGDYTFNVHIASVTSPYVAIVEGEDITPALTSDTFDDVLRAAVSGFETSSHLDLVSQSDTTFQGHKARQGIFSHEGTRFVFLAFVLNGSQIYALFAPQGEKFDALAGSFQATA